MEAIWEPVKGDASLNEGLTELDTGIGVGKWSVIVAPASILALLLDEHAILP
jgi:hypothetical protein